METRTQIKSTNRADSSCGERARKFSGLFVALVLAYLAFSQKARAIDPPPDGGYANFTTAEGSNALKTLTTGSANTAVGWYSLFSDTAGSFNTADGAGALLFNTADANTAFGAAALLFNTTGASNAAVGAATLLNNTDGSGNTASGYQALFSNQTGDNNAAYGYTALYHNTADFNTALGSQTLVYNTTGFENTAAGYQALVFNDVGFQNTAIGAYALFSNTGGAGNNAVGYVALHSNTDGSYNNAVGHGALYSNIAGNGNTAVGLNALRNNAGSNNTAIGIAAGFELTTGSNNVCVGAAVSGVAGESSTTRIANISGTPQDTGIYVTLDAVGGTKLGYFNAASSRRFKEDIKPMDKSSEPLFALKPVNFRYKPEINPDRAERFGLIAEEVEKINPDLVSHDSEGKPLTVRYDSINAMLLNEFLKEHCKVEQQQATITQIEKDFETVRAQQQKEIRLLSAELKEQALQIQKVNARVETRETAPRMVFNNP